LDFDFNEGTPIRESEVFVWEMASRQNERDNSRVEGIPEENIMGEKLLSKMKPV